MQLSDYDDRDEDHYSEDDFDPDAACLICGGDGLVDNDDPIQRGPEEFLKCFSCNGSGKKKDMTVW